ncbi:MAG: hypothetical protein K9K76_04215 [Halanaerobiales bacterium]|nr:hypothetical protein [Halanaerobiales bacterium]
MKKIHLIILLILINLVVAPTAVAGNTATQDITITAEPINEVSLSKTTLSLTITPPIEDLVEEEVIDSSTTLSYSTNQTNQKITVKVDRTLPVGLTLLVEATSTGGTSSGAVALDTSDNNLITGLSNLSDSGETVTYTLKAINFAEPTATETFTVTYTITSSS